MSVLQLVVNIFAFVCFTQLTWNIQVKIGNWLKHKHPSWKILRFFWWSMCDVEGFCEYEIYDHFIKPQREEFDKRNENKWWYKILNKINPRK